MPPPSLLPTHGAPTGEPSPEDLRPHTAPAATPTAPAAAAAAPIRVLVVDDDAGIRELLADYLQRQGMAVQVAADGAGLWAALARAQGQGQAVGVDPIDLIVLDLNLPGQDGLALCRELRARGLATPVIMLTARADPIDRVVGLELGADDYMPKPFEPRELAARIRTVLRRLAPAPASGTTSVGAAGAAGAAFAGGSGSGVSGAWPGAPTAIPSAASSATSSTGPVEVLRHEGRAPRLRFAGWTLDVAARELSAPEGTVVMLTSGEFRLLRVLAERAGRVLSRDDLLTLTQGREAAPFDRSIDLHISRLRAKLRDDARQPRLLKTVRNEGYLLTATVERIA